MASHPHDSDHKSYDNERSEIGDSVIKQFEKLRGARVNFDDQWRQVAERVIPSYKDEFQSGNTNRTQGERKTQLLIDSTATTALGRFASIMDSLLTPRNAQWHKLRVSDPNLEKEREVRLWFEAVTDALFKFRYTPKANFASQNYMIYQLLGAFGNAPMFIDELADEPGVRYKACNLGGTYLAQNHQGLVDTVFRIFKLTIRQALQQWPDTLPDKIRELGKGDGGMDKEMEFVHCVKPRKDIDLERGDFKAMPFVSYYVSLTEKMVVEEGGYRSFPYAYSRYEQFPNEDYGRSPAMDVLPSIKTLNEQKRTLLKQGHRATDPVLLAYDDGVTSRFSMRPGAINPGGVTRDGRPLIHALPVGNVNTGRDAMEDERLIIKDAFLVTLFQILVDSPTMTATEVLERVREKGILLAPAFSRQEAEYLGPMIVRELDILSQQFDSRGESLLPPIPPVLLEAEGDYTIFYDSPFSRTQRAEESAGFMRTYEFAVGIATNTQNMNVLDHFDDDVFIPEMAHNQGVPERWMRSQEKVDEIREARAEAQAKQQQMDNAGNAAALIKAAAVAKEKAPEEFDAIASQAGQQ